MGKMLYIDLTTRDIREEDLTPTNIASRFIGAFGISARLAYDLIKPGIDPLSPENVIIIGAGPLVGTSCPSASRVSAWTKFPLGNTIGPGSGSMNFSSGLKHAGYDELIITGRASKPVFLKVSDEGVEICDAGNLWGNDNYEATDEIWKRYGTDYSVICIGQAGENLVKISLAIVDKSATLGRHGLGAVMGSKNLKLIVAGGKRKVRVSDRAKFTELTHQIMAEVMNWPILDEYVNLGHVEYDSAALGRYALEGYYSQPCDPVSSEERFGHEVYLQRLKKARLACSSCPIACRDVEQVRQEEGKTLLTFQPHPDILVGLRLGLQSLEEVSRVAHFTQIYGVDRLSFASGATFLIDLYKRGIITKYDLEGIEMGNEKSFTELIEKVAFRQGVGNILADGLPGIVKRFGKECEKYSNCIKGVEPFLDARMVNLNPAMFGAAVSPHNFGSPKGAMLSPAKFVIGGGGTEIFRKYGEWITIPSKALDRIFDTPFKVNVARFSRHSEDFFATFENLGVCARFHIHQFFGMERMAGLYSAATGIEMDAYELKRTAERAWNILKALNVREGLSRNDDKFPPKWLEPLKRGDEEIRLKDLLGIKALTSEDLEKMVDDYYDERGWDIETGIPTRETLEEIGLRDVADDLAEQGILPARRVKGWRVGHWGAELK
jgi:aldehyde:ferredoxin oxidoreductase